MSIYKRIQKELQASKTAALVTVLPGTDPLLSSKRIVLSESGIIDGDLDEKTARGMLELIKQASSDQNAPVNGVIEDQSKGLRYFIKRYEPFPRLIILGGGHVGSALCKLAANFDYYIIIVDDRPSFASPAVHPDADQVICDSYEEALDSITSSPSDYIVIVTRGHRYDKLCLIKSLQRETAYVGMIGSKKRVGEQLKELTREGFPVQKTSAVYSPIGLKIGALTEPEIALSIMAEITMVRRSKNKEEAVQADVLNALTKVEGSGDKAVLATIIKAVGSTPRKTGAQMLIYPDGSIIGTLGGGCAEAEVKQEALYCLDHGLSGLKKVELTADSAADQGMACGGIMEIFLEPVF